MNVHWSSHFEHVCISSMGHKFDPTLELQQQFWTQSGFSRDRFKEFLTIQALPAEAEEVYYRGVPKSAYEVVKDNYKRGIRIQWSGLPLISDAGVLR